MANNYVDKTTFLNDIREYKLRKQSNPDEPIPVYSANAILQIANRLANRPNFIGYSYRDDMVSDGVYTCMRYFDNFDTDHATYNPFGYFSRIIWQAFVLRIKKEHKMAKIKSKILASAAFESFAFQYMDNDEDFKNSFTEFLQDNNYSMDKGEILPVEIADQDQLDAINSSTDEIEMELDDEEHDNEFDI